MEKIIALLKAFLQKKSVKIAGGIVTAIAAIGLFICGIRTKELVPLVTTVIVAALAAAYAAVTIITGITTEKE